MMYLDEQLRWVTTQDPVNAEDIHKMLREGIGKMENPPTKIIMRPEVYHILEVACNKYMIPPKEGYNTYCGIPIEVKDLPDGQLALLLSEQIT